MSVTASASITHSDLVERARRLRLLADRLETEATAWLEPEVSTDRWWNQVIDRRSETKDIVDGSSAEQLVASAVLAAIRGDSARARVYAARGEHASLGTGDLVLGANFARAIAWMGDGNCDAAFDALSGQFRIDKSPSWIAALVCTAGVLAEIAIRAHRVPEAREMLEQWIPVVASIVGPERQEFELAQLLLRGSDRVEALRGALASPRGWTLFATGRIHLALGMTMRRERRMRDSRSHLLVATDLFEELHAAPWLAVAKNELRASGLQTQPERPNSTLSAQERAVVELASRGLSNREIGERLYLSPRTVGSHLYRVFPKLGITSRHQLAGGLERLFA